MIGGGRYEGTCLAAREVTDADVIVLIVVNGSAGSGFSVAVNSQRVAREEAVGNLPALLRTMAEHIEAQQKGQN